MDSENPLIGRHQSEVSLVAVSVARSLGGSSVATGSAAIKVDFNDEAPQFTLKATLAGIVAGTVCTFLALYYGLKVGITPSLNIVGGVLGYSMAKLFMRVPGMRGRFTPQENAVIQTFSVAVYSVACPSMGFTSGWLGLSEKAYQVTHLSYDKADDVVDTNFLRSVLWSLSLALFGFFIAYPVRHYYIIRKSLLFPSGTATAYVINALHASKMQARIGLNLLGKYFSIAFVVNMITWFCDGLAAFPLFGMSAADWGFTLDFDLGTGGIGMLLGFPINLSMVFGAVMVHGVLNPAIDKHRDSAHNWVGDKDAWYNSNEVESPYLGNAAYGLFIGLALMLVQGAFAVCEMAVIVTLANVRKGNALEPLALEPDEQRRVEIFSKPGYPIWASALGYAASGGVTIIVHHFMLDTTWYQTLAAIAIIPVLALANIEGIGRTDWDVAAAYGKLVMFPVGAMNDSIKPAVAICHTTISGCSNAAMLMQDFKTGYILGADPQMMFYSQVVGILFGCFITPGLFSMMVSAFDLPVNRQEHPDAFVTGLYGPIYRTLAVVATQGGFDSLPVGCLWISLAAAILALVFCMATTISEVYFPALVPFIPNVSGCSIGVLIGPTVPIQFTIGSLIVWWWSRYHPERAHFEKMYAASGLISGSGFAVVLQVICALGGFNVPIEVHWAKTPDHTMDAGAWVVSIMALILFFACIALGAWVWFKVPDGDLTKLTDEVDEGSTDDEDNRAARNQYVLDLEDIAADAPIKSKQD